MRYMINNFFQDHIPNRTTMPQKRKLRSDGACQPLQNIFKNQHYRSILPLTLLNKISKTPIISCDKINQLKIQPSADHQLNLKLMKQAMLEYTDIKSSNKDRYYESEQQYMKKPWKRNDAQFHHFDQEILNINFLKEIDQFIME